jgi:hypothetical protein
MKNLVGPPSRRAARTLPVPVRIIRVPWLIPGWARAQTWRQVILVRRGVKLTTRLLAHELAHVLQWRAFGPFGFVRRYARHLWAPGYEHHPLEIIARLAEQDEFYLTWAREILIARNNHGHFHKT